MQVAATATHSYETAPTASCSHACARFRVESCRRRAAGYARYVDQGSPTVRGALVSHASARASRRMAANAPQRDPTGGGGWQQLQQRNELDPGRRGAMRLSPHCAMRVLPLRCLDPPLLCRAQTVCGCRCLSICARWRHAFCSTAVLVRLTHGLGMRWRIRVYALSPG